MTTHRLRNRWIELRFRALQRLDAIDRRTAALALAGALALLGLVAYLVV